jgi:hypothetical protein
VTGRHRTEEQHRHRIALELARAAMYLRQYQQPGLARQVDEVADLIHIGQLTERPPR